MENVAARDQPRARPIGADQLDFQLDWAAGGVDQDALH